MSSGEDSSRFRGSAAQLIWDFLDGGGRFRELGYRLEEGWLTLESKTLSLYP